MDYKLNFTIMKKIKEILEFAITFAISFGCLYIISLAGYLFD